MAADKRRSAPPGRADYDRAPTAPTDLLPTTQFPTMSSNRRTRLTTVLIALVSLLFMQLALAGYACPASGTKAPGAAAMADSSMPCAGSMQSELDDAQPGLCTAHCQADPQTADRPEQPLPLALGALPAGFAMPARVTRLSSAPCQTPHLMRTTAPPVAISHCCFRL